MAVELYDHDGVRLRLEGRGRRDGDSTVYGVEGDASSQVKVYRRETLTPGFQAKLIAMARTRPADATLTTTGHPSIAWVEELVYSDPEATNVAGCLMPFVDLKVLGAASDYHDPRTRQMRFGGRFTWQHLLTAADSLAAAVAAVHQQGHRIGYLSDANVMVAPSGLVTLVDCFRFQIRDPLRGGFYLADVSVEQVRTEYLPAEVLKAHYLAEDELDLYHADLFALATLIFRFLMLGVHPFHARGELVAKAPTIEAKILTGHFPYDTKVRGIAPPEFAPDFGLMPPRLRGLFLRAFVDGHRQPHIRPSAEDWRTALTLEARSLRQCQINPNHWHAARVRVCPWCTQVRAKGTDPFPSSDGLNPLASLHTDPETVSMAERREHLRTYVRAALRDSRISMQQADNIQALGSQLGLSSSDVKRITTAELRSGSSAARVTRPSSGRPAGEALDRVRFGAVGAARRVGEFSRSERWKATAPFACAGAAAGAVTPVVVPLILILLLTPAVVTYGQLLGEPPAKVWWRSVLHAAPRFLLNIPRALFHVLQLMVPFWLILAVPYTALAIGVSSDIALRLLGAAAVLGWASYLLVYAMATDTFVKASRVGWNAIVWVTLGDMGSMSWVGYVLWLFAAALGVAAALGFISLWPIGGGWPR